MITQLGPSSSHELKTTHNTSGAGCTVPAETSKNLIGITQGILELSVFFVVMHDLLNKG